MRSTKLYIMIVSMIVISVLSVFTAKQVWKADETQLKKEISELRKEISNYKNQVTAFQQKKYAYFRPHIGHGELPLEFNADEPSERGTAARVNVVDNMTVEVIDERDNWSRIVLYGWIPEWYLVDDPLESEPINVTAPQKLFLKEHADMLMYPDDRSKTLFKNISRGKAVVVTKQYRDWSYITLRQVSEAPSYTEGWIKSTLLGTKDQTEPLEGILKADTKAYVVDDFSEIWKAPKDRIEIVREPKEITIAEKRDKWAKVSTSEGWGAWVQMKNIEF